MTVINLSQGFSRSGQQNPLLFSANSHCITRPTWQQQVIQLANYLRQQEQRHWLLFEPNLADFSVMFFALLSAQKHIILPPSDKLAQLESIKDNVDATIGSVTLAGVNCVSRAQAQAVMSLSGENNVSNDILIDSQQSIDFFTSGSSGTAKKIGKTWGQIQHEVNDLETLWGNKLGQSSIVATVSHQHIYGLIFKLLWPLLAGRSIWPKTISYPEELALLLQKQNSAISLISSPAFLARTCQEPLWQCNAKHINTLFSSGGPLSLNAANTIENALNQSPIEVFGSTETGGIAWRQQGQGPLWHPFEALNICVTQDSQRLAIQSPYLEHMYHPNANDGHWYTTDDRAKLASNGDLQLLGRADRMVKIEEKRLSLDELEMALCRHPWIEQARVLLTQGKRLQLGAAVVLNQQGHDELNSNHKRHINTVLRQHLSEHFETILLPRKWRYLDALPINSQGKLCHQDIIALFEPACVANDSHMNDEDKA